jgi:hypothetical protein
MRNINPSKLGLAFVLCFYIVSGCSKSSSSNNNCNFATGSATAGTGAQVTYVATGTGSASLSSVIYQDVNGPVKISNPALPWSISLVFPAGGNVSLSAEGTASNGGILTLSYGINASGSFNADTVACGH